MGVVNLENRPRLRKERKSDRSNLGPRPYLSSLRRKAPLLQPQLTPPSSPAAQPSSYIGPYKCSVPPKNIITPPITPHNSFSPPAPTYVPFPLRPDHIIGYGRYRKLKCASKEDILSHIDAQITDISTLLIHSKMLDCKIPGYDDITFGERLWVKSEHEMDQARIALKPSTEQSSNGTVIYRGFPDAERIIMRAVARNTRSLLLADELVHPRGVKGSSYRDCSFDPMARPDKGNAEAWGKIGFTLHPLPTRTRLVRRKWNKLEKLQPMWGPTVAKREAAQRYRQEQKAAAYIRANGNAAGCFRVEGGPSTGGYRVNIGGGKGKLGNRMESSQTSKPKHDDNDNDDRAKALMDIENAIASDSDSGSGSGNSGSNYDTANETAIESNSKCTVVPKNPLPKSCRRETPTSRPPVPLSCRPKKVETQAYAAPSLDAKAASSHHDTKSKGKGKAKDYGTEAAAGLAKRRVVRFAV